MEECIPKTDLVTLKSQSDRGEVVCVRNAFERHEDMVEAAKEHRNVSGRKSTVSYEPVPSAVPSHYSRCTPTRRSAAFTSTFMGIHS